MANRLLRPCCAHQIYTHTGCAVQTELPKNGQIQRKHDRAHAFQILNANKSSDREWRKNKRSSHKWTASNKTPTIQWFICTRILRPSTARSNLLNWPKSLLLNGKKMWKNIKYTQMHGARIHTWPPTHAAVIHNHEPSLVCTHTHSAQLENDEKEKKHTPKTQMFFESFSSEFNSSSTKSTHTTVDTYYNTYERQTSARQHFSVFLTI